MMVTYMKGFAPALDLLSSEIHRYRIKNTAEIVEEPSSMMAKSHGSCLCREVTYTFTGEPVMQVFGP